MNKLSLKKISTSARSVFKNKDQANTATQELQKQIYDLLYLMFAHDKYSLLIILHGIDASGKDGTVRLLFSAANPQGMRVFSFKKPTSEERRHDFLWRCHLHTPESGLTTIFNRSYYEEVTTAMVHPELLKAQHIPDEIIKKPDFFEQRYKRINEFEKLLEQKGTIVLKFFLHISKQEQQQRIQARLKNRSKNWKFSIEDINERKHWDQYMAVFQKMLNATNSKHAPWTVVPADDKWYRNYFVLKTVAAALQKLEMEFPEPVLK